MKLAEVRKFAELGVVLRQRRGAATLRRPAGPADPHSDRYSLSRACNSLLRGLASLKSETHVVTYRAGGVSTGARESKTQSLLVPI